MAGKFRLYTGSNGKYYFQLKAANGQVILQSQGYASKSSANNGIQSVRNNCGADDRYERKVGKNGQHYFVLKAANGQVIGSSEMYKQQNSCENGIASVKKNGATAGVDDQAG